MNDGEKRGGGDKGGGEAHRNKAILSGFSCDSLGEMLISFSSPFALQSALILTSSRFPPKTSPKTTPPLPKYYYRNKSFVFPKHPEKKICL